MSTNEREGLEVEVGGVDYVVGGITPRRCLHVCRRMAPFIGNLAPVLKQIFDEDEKAKEEAIEVEVDDGPDTLEEAEELAARKAAQAEADAEEDEEGETKKKGPDPIDAVVVGVPIIMETFARMSDADVDYVLDNLLCGAHVKRASGAIMPLVEGGRLKNPKLKLAVQLELAARVFVFNLEDFFAALPSAFQEKARKAGSRFQVG